MLMLSRYHVYTNYFNFWFTSLYSDLSIKYEVTYRKCLIKYKCKEKAQEAEENANWYRCNQGENSTQTNKIVHKIPHICYS